MKRRRAVRLAMVTIASSWIAWVSFHALPFGQWFCSWLPGENLVDLAQSEVGSRVAIDSLVELRSRLEAGTLSRNHDDAIRKWILRLATIRPNEHGYVWNHNLRARMSRYMESSLSRRPLDQQAYETMISSAVRVAAIPGHLSESTHAVIIDISNDLVHAPPCHVVASLSYRTSIGDLERSSKAWNWPASSPMVISVEAIDRVAVAIEVIPNDPTLHAFEAGTYIATQESGAEASNERGADSIRLAGGAIGLFRVAGRHGVEFQVVARFLFADDCVWCHRVVLHTNDSTVDLGVLVRESSAEASTVVRATVLSDEPFDQILECDVELVPSQGLAQPMLEAEAPVWIKNVRLLRPDA